MTTQAHPAPTGTSHRQCPAEGFTCYQPLEEEHPCSPAEDAWMWIGAILGSVFGIALLVHVWRWFA